MGGTAVAGRRLADLGAGRARRAPVTPLERRAAGHVREHAGEGSAPQAGRTPRQGSHTGLLVAGAGAALPKAIASWGSPRGRAGSVPGIPGTFPGGSWRREPSSPTACLLAFLIQTLKSELSLLYGPVGKRGFEPRPVRLRGGWMSFLLRRVGPSRVFVYLEHGAIFFSDEGVFASPQHRPLHPGSPLRGRARQAGGRRTCWPWQRPAEGGRTSRRDRSREAGRPATHVRENDSASAFACSGACEGV